MFMRNTRCVRVVHADPGPAVENVRGVMAAGRFVPMMEHNCKEKQKKPSNTGAFVGQRSRPTS